MKLFVTGGTGFLGAHVLNLAVAARHAVVAPRRPGSRPRINVSPEVQWVEGGLERAYDRELAGCDALIHLAAHGVLEPSPDWDACFHQNVQLPLRLWQQAVNAGVPRLVIAGTCSEYGRSGETHDTLPPTAPLLPTGPYHAAKAAATMAAIGFCHERQVSVAILRPFHLYGDGEAPARFWAQLQAAARSGADFVMTSGEQVRDFTPVTLAAQTFLDAATQWTLPPGEPRIENVGTGEATSLRDFARREWERLGARGELRLGHRAQRPGEVMRYVAQKAGNSSTPHMKSA
jgi:nucleoside-diphosphate-sugar epimerase